MIGGELFADWLPGDNEGDKELLFGLMRLANEMKRRDNDDR
jgi:hypothetical protein